MRAKALFKHALKLEKQPVHTPSIDIQVVTTSPFHSNLVLRAGLDPKSAAYTQTLAALSEETDEFFIPNKDDHLSPQKYETIDEDDCDLRLFIFSPKRAKDAPKVDFHLYGNGISVL